MKDVLCICNTFYQLIVAIQLKCTLRQTDNFTLILTDQINQSAVSFVKKIKNSGLFENVCYFETKKIRIGELSILKKINSFFNAITGGKSFICHEEINRKIFDEFLYFNEEDLAVYILFALVYKNNSHISCNRFEEGLGTYNYIPKISKKIQIINSIRKINKHATLPDCTNLFYCFRPTLYNGNLEAVRIPQITADSILVKKLRIFFHLNQNKKLNYPQKYIFFGSVFDEEGGSPIGEFSIISRIAEIVGKDNLLVKLHPRVSSKKYINNGFCVDINSSLPWEIIQLSFDFSNHIFLTTLSTSIITANLIVAKPANTLLLYPLCDIRGNELANINFIFFEKLSSSIPENNDFTFLNKVNTLKELSYKLHLYFSS